MKRVTLPGGLEIWALNATDAGVLHTQIFVNGAYDGHGISLRDGDCVVDAGANLGLATLWFAGRAKHLKQVAIEPNPAVSECLRRNVPSHVTTVQCALGEAPGEAELSWDPFVSSTGSLVPAPRIDAAALAEDLGVPRVAAAAVGLVRRLAQRKVRVKVRTLSDVMTELKLERIDLLKLDVEGVEARVLAGIADHDWPKIRQAIVETSDVEGISATLRARGFQLEVDQEPFATIKQLGLHNVYARRP